MKTWASILLFCSILSIGCGSDKVINGRTYDTVGLLSSEGRDPCIRYKVVKANVFLGIFFSAGIIIPIYCFGFDLWEPSEIKPECIKASQPKDTI